MSHETEHTSKTTSSKAPPSAELHRSNAVYARKRKDSESNVSNQSQNDAKHVYRRRPVVPTRRVSGSKKGNSSEVLASDDLTSVPNKVPAEETQDRKPLSRPRKENRPVADRTAGRRPSSSSSNRPTPASPTPLRISTTGLSSASKPEETEILPVSPTEGSRGRHHHSHSHRENEHVTGVSRPGSADGKQFADRPRSPFNQPRGTSLPPTSSPLRDSTSSLRSATEVKKATGDTDKSRRIISWLKDEGRGRQDDWDLRQPISYDSSDTHEYQRKSQRKKDAWDAVLTGWL